MMRWLQRRWISKNNYPKGDSITEKNVAEWWTINLLWEKVFLFVLFCFCFVLFCFVLFCFVLFCFVLFCFVLFCFVFRKKRLRLIYCKNHTKQGTEDIQTFTRTQPKTLTAFTYNIPHKPHTTIHPNQKCAYIWWYDQSRANKQIYKWWRFKIKGPFLKMLPQLPFAFSSFILSVPLNFNQH